MAEKASLIIEVVENGVKKTTIDLKALSRASEQAEKSSKRGTLASRDFNRALEGTSNNARRAGENMALLSRVAATYLSYEAVKKARNIADSMSNMRTQIQLVTSTQQEALLVQEELFSVSLRTYASLEATTTLYTRTARALKDAGKSQADFLKFTEAINNAMRIGGANATEQASALLQLSQALGSGVLQGDEFRSIAENAPILLDLVAKELGVVRGEVKKLASEGKITSEIIFNALTKSADQLAQDASRVIVTTAAATENFRSSLYKYADEMLNSTGVTTSFVSVVTLLGNEIEIVGGVVGSLVAGAIAAYIAKMTISTSVTVAQTFASIKAADAARIHASKELELAIAMEKQARSAAKVAAANIALGGSHARATQANMAHLASVHRLNAAKASTISVAGGLLRVLGGGAGLVGLVATAASMFFMLSSDTDKAKVSLDEIIAPIDEVIDKFKKIDDISQRKAIRDYAEKELLAIDALKKAQDDLVRHMVNTSIKAHSEMMPAWGEGAGTSVFMRDLFTETFLKVVEEAKESGEDLFKLFEKSLEKLGLPKEVANQWLDQISHFQEAANQKRILTEVTKALNKEQEKAQELAKAQANIYDPAAIVMSGKDPKLSEQAAKAMKEIKKSRLSLSNMTELQVLERRRENGELDKLKAGEYELLELEAKRNDELKGIADKQTSINGIVEGINRQYATLGMTSAQTKIFDLEAMGADPKLIGDMKDKLEKIGNHSFGTSSIDHYNDRLQDMSRELSEIISLNKELEATGYTSQYNAVSRITLELNDQSSTLSKISEAQKQILIDQAQQIDNANQLNAILNFSNDYSRRFEDMEFELELMGKTKREIEGMRFAYELEKQAKQMSIGMSRANIETLEEEIRKYHELYGVIQQERGRKDDSYIEGIKKGFSDYIDSVGTVSENTAEAIGMTFGHLESQLVNFAQTSKFSFSDMTSSILQDLSKILIRMGMMNMVVAGFGENGTGGFFGDLFKGWGRFSDGGYTGHGGVHQPAGVVHKGEVVFSQRDIARLGGVGVVEGLRTSGRLSGYSSGGVVGVPPSFPSRSKSKLPQSNSEPINISVIVNTEDGTVETNADEISAKLKRSVEVIVDQRMARNKRPGGGY